MANDHYAPQFYLRNFAIDADKKKVTAVKKQGSKAIWQICSIRSIGSAKDLYTRQVGSELVSFESKIDRTIESPLAKTQTWQKICAGDAHLLDASDKPMLYAIVRHLEARTPHWRKTMEELSQLSSNPGFTMADSERAFFASLRDDSFVAEEVFENQASSLGWTVENYHRANISVFRTSVRLKTSTNPVFNIRVPDHPGLYLPLPGMIPYMNVLPITPHALVTLVMGDIGSGFINMEIDDSAAAGFNRQRVGQFAFFPTINHLICDREDVVSEMTWGPYSLDYETDKKVVFSRTDAKETIRT